MAFGRSLTFAEPDQYQSALRAVSADVIVSGRGPFHARLTRVNFSRLWLQGGSDNLPRIARLANDPTRVPIFLQTVSDQAPVVISGKEVSPGELVFFRRGETYINRSVGPNCWGAMSLDPDALETAGRLIAGRELTSPSQTYSMRPPPELLGRLTRLHQRAVQLVDEAPERLEHPEVARSMEHDLVHLMVRSITDNSTSEERIGTFHHKAIMRRFEELVSANPHRPLHLADVCAATGATERTLLRCCHDQLGMGPIRFLWLRRMNMVRAALARADAMSSSVTEVATAHGFWELGRFAVSYRKIYGESPSRTLARESAWCSATERFAPSSEGPNGDLAGTA